MGLARQTLISLRLLMRFRPKVVLIESHFLFLGEVSMPRLFASYGKVRG